MEKVLSNLQRTGINDRVKIAILDSGIDAEKKSIGKTVRYIFKHSLLRQKFNNSLKGYYDFSDAKEPEEMRDQYGHGTHTTGLLLKVAPRAEIFVAQVGKGTQNSAKSIKFAPDVDMVAKVSACSRCRIIIFSLSFPRQLNMPQTNGTST
jgi:hypothetical protein